jgi:outer membrane protein TolC
VTASAVLLAAALLAAAPPGDVPPPAPEPAPQAIGFDEAVQRALARHPTARGALEEIRRTEGLRLQAASGALPALGATGTQTRLDSNRVTESGGSQRVIAARDQSNATLALTVPLVAPSRWTQWSHGSLAVDAAVAAEADARRSVAVLAGQAYIAVLAGQNAVRVSESGRETARAHYDFAHTRREAGMGSTLDELQAEQELAASEVQYQSALDALARAREALGIVTGSDGPLDAGAQPSLAAPPGGGSDVERRADVKAARARATVAERTASDSWADWLPTLFGQAQGFLQDPPTLTTPRSGWQAQLVLSLPLLEGGLRVGQRQERDALAREAELQVEALVRQARAEVRSTWGSFQRARLAADAARRGAGAAKAALDLATSAYREGAVNSLQVIDSQRRDRDAALATVAAEQGERLALLDLLAATGSFP